MGAFLTTGLLLLALLSCGQSSRGQLTIQIRFPFHVATIPDNTDSIGIVVRQGDQTLTQARLTRSKPSIIMNALPSGQTEVVAVAFDGGCRALASAKSIVHIQPSTVNRAILDLGRLDEQMSSLVSGDCSPSVEPSAAASARPAEVPSSDATDAVQPPDMSGGDSNSVPVLTLIASETTVDEGMPISLKVAISDPDSTPASMTYNWSASPNVGSFSGTTSTTGSAAFRSWTPPLVAAATTVNVRVTVTDGANVVSSNAVTLTINNVVPGSVTIGGTL